MSIDSTYILQWEGPYGDNEINSYEQKFKDRFPVFYTRELGDGAFLVEVKRNHDEEVREFAKEYSSLSVVTKDEQNQRWRILHDYVRDVRDA